MDRHDVDGILTKGTKASPPRTDLTELKINLGKKQRPDKFLKDISVIMGTTARSKMQSEHDRAFTSQLYPVSPLTPNHSQTSPSLIRSFARLAEINESLKISNSS